MKIGIGTLLIAGIIVAKLAAPSTEETIATKHTNGYDIDAQESIFCRDFGLIPSDTEDFLKIEEKQTPIVVEEEKDPYEEHYLCQSKDSGSCKELRGEIIVTFVFLNDAEDVWTYDEIEAFKNTMQVQTQFLREEAAQYGQTPEFYAIYTQGSVDQFVSMSNRAWVDEALQSAGLPEQSAFYAQMSENYNGAQVPVVFCLSRDGRAYARSCSGGDNMEYCVVYEDCEAYGHELLHLFCAKDYYVGDTISTAAKNYFGNSVMLNSQKTDVDSLTAYLVGWTEEIDETAQAFLEATAHVTQEQRDRDDAENFFTGYGTKNGDDYTYTGYMYEGTYHGQGTIRWDNGDSYTGDWVCGRRTGQGLYIWADGSRYEGQWENGERSGYGVYTSCDGRVLKGIWKGSELVEAY